MNEILYLVILSVSSVVYLFLIAKLLGKRQVAQLEFVDYIIGISIGSISAEMATDLPFYMVCDGKISFSSLSELGKDLNWLFEKLNAKNKNDLKKIILAIYDQDIDVMTIN